MLYTAKVTKNGEVFHATLDTSLTEYVEYVQRQAGGVWEVVHTAQFPARSLGGASRAEYTSVMCASIAAQWFRDSC